ncbi:MAG: MFS transporter [Candidatus Eisenbacteria bacterium]|nr:MFS transporter [Candidatus Eisenbacteria bacterium]
MSPITAVWKDYRDAAREFSRPARHYLLGELLAWTGHGVFQVLFNLYLLEAHFQEAFIGHAIALHGLGMACAALPAGVLADRWGRRRTLILGAVLDGLGMAARANTPAPGVILAASVMSGAGQALLAIAAAPFLTEHSSPRERTHLFSAFFANSLIAGVAGSLIGGWLPRALTALPAALRPDSFHSFRIALSLAATLAVAAAIPLLRLGALAEAAADSSRDRVPPGAARLLFPIALNAFLIGVGAGLVIPFMNLYFATRFHCSSVQIGLFFSIAQVCTACAALLGPALAQRFGKLRTATVSELLSLPFLVTLGAERRLGVAVVSFWFRASLMQASTPLIQAFVMEALPPALRSRATSFINLVWNLGWAASATLAGVVIQRFGYAVPFYITAVTYFLAASTFYLLFRRWPEVHASGVPGPDAALIAPDPTPD